MVEELDKDQLKLLKNAFEAFDTEKAGVIETSMIGMILEMLGQTLDDKSLKAVIKTHDPRGTGKLNFEEFALLASSFVEVEEDIEAIRQELKEAFRLYDKEGRGYLTLEVLKDILHELDDKITDEDLDMMIDEIDADGSGTVDFEEFMEVMTVLQNAFNAFDSDHTGFIHMEDIGTIIEMLGQKLDDGTLKALIREHDPRGTGKLNFERFAVLAGNYVEVEEDVEAIRQELKEAFRLYDKEGRGYLTIEVLRDILHELDDKITEEDLDMMIDEIDADGSGTVDFEEFMEVMTGEE